MDKLNTENLQALLRGEKLNSYQLALANKEYKDLIFFAYEAEKKVKNIDVTQCCKSDSEQLCEYCGLPLQEGVNLDYCKNDYCTRND